MSGQPWLDQVGAVDLAVSVFRRPAGHADLLHGRGVLPDDIVELIKVALDAIRHRDETQAADERHHAALFFVEHVLLAAPSDHYRVLGLKRQADTDEVREHYRLMMAVFHPDRGGWQDGDREALAARINLAHQVLRDPARRAAYDLELLRHERARVVDVRAAGSKPFVPARKATVRPATPPRPWGARLPPVVQRHLPQFVLAAVAVVGVLIVLGAYVTRPSTPSLARDVHAVDRTAAPLAGAGERTPGIDESEQAAAGDEGDEARVGIPATHAGGEKPRSLQAMAAAGMEPAAAVGEVASAPPRSERPPGMVARPSTAPEASASTALAPRTAISPPIERVDVPARAAASESVVVSRPVTETLPLTASPVESVAPLAKPDAPVVVVGDVDQVGMIDSGDSAVGSVKVGGAEIGVVDSVIVESDGVEPQVVPPEVVAHRPWLDEIPPDLPVPSGMGAATFAESGGGEQDTASAIQMLESLDLMAKFARIYRRGDLDGFMSLFTASARSNSGDWSAIRADYEGLFRGTSSREIDLHQLEWTLEGEKGVAEGGFIAKVRSLGAEDVSIYVGTIRLELTKSEGQVRISGMYHEIAE